MVSQEKSWVDHIEETLIALILGSMTLITFANVVVRKVFNGNILWALEAEVFLFAWLVLLGASWCVKVNAHLGVDAVVAMFDRPMRKAITLAAVALSLVFCVIVFVGACQYWWKFATTAAFLETNDVPMPEALQFLADWVNEGERYEKMPRFLPYLALPLGFGLLIIRLLEAGWRVYTDRQELIIVSHEAEEALESVRET